MITFLHHSDPTIPHFRKEEWSFLRGAASTVDRPTLGWIGRVFLHNVAHPLLHAPIPALTHARRSRTTTSRITSSRARRSVGREPRPASRTR